MERSDWGMEMINLYTVAHKRPDFLEMQLSSFRKNIIGDFNFIVFNNALFDKNKDHYYAIHKFCKENNIQCIDVQKDDNLVAKIHSYDGENVFNGFNEYSNPCIACAYPLCWMWEKFLVEANDKICIIDSDMFFVDKKNIDCILDEFDIVYMPQDKGNQSGDVVHYMWNGLCFMNLAKLPDKQSLSWWCGYCEKVPVDVGGRTHFYLKQYKDKLKTKLLKIYYYGDDPECNFSPSNYEYLGIDDEKLILHYRGGSNWDYKSEDYHTKKTLWLKSKL
jgi:hypothetical protein